MAERRTMYEIYWEILLFCKTPRSITSIINRCDLNSKKGQEHLQFLCGKGYLSSREQEGKRQYTTTPEADEFLSLFTRLYLELFDERPEFKI